MQEDQAYSKPLVLDSLYPMISPLIRHAQGQTLAQFKSLKPQRHKSEICRVGFHTYQLQINGAIRTFAH